MSSIGAKRIQNGTDSGQDAPREKAAGVRSRPHRGIAGGPLRNLAAPGKCPNPAHPNHPERTSKRAFQAGSGQYRGRKARPRGRRVFREADMRRGSSQSRRPASRPAPGSPLGRDDGQPGRPPLRAPDAASSVPLHCPSSVLPWVSGRPLGTQNQDTGDRIGLGQRQVHL